MPSFAGVVDVSQVPSFASVCNSGPGTISPESGNMMAMSDFVSDIDPGPEEPLLPSRVGVYMPSLPGVVDVSKVPNYVSFGDPRPGTISPGSGNMMAMPNFINNFDPGPGVPLLQSGVSLSMPNFAGNVDKLQIQDFGGAIDSGPGTTSPGFGGVLAAPDFFSVIDPGPGEPLLESAVVFDWPNDVVSDLFRSGGQIPGNSDGDGCHSVMCTLPPDPGGDYVSALSVRPVLARFMMFIMALLQSVLSGISRQKFAPGSWCRRMFVSPVVCVVGSVMCASALSVRPVFARIMMFIVALLQSVLFGISRQKFALGSWCRQKFVSPGVVLGHPGAPVL